MAYSFTILDEGKTLTVAHNPNVQTGETGYIFSVDGKLRSEVKYTGAAVRTRPQLRVD